MSDPYLSFAAGLNGLAGPLHGLANQEVCHEECINFINFIQCSLVVVFIPLSLSPPKHWNNNKGKTLCCMMNYVVQLHVPLTVFQMLGLLVMKVIENAIVY